MKKTLFAFALVTMAVACGNHPSVTAVGNSQSSVSTEPSRKVSSENLKEGNDQTQEILDSSIVKSTFDLMQLKTSNACKPLTADSVHWMCLGALMPVTRLTLTPSGCGFAVEIDCGATNAQISGMTRKISARDENGYRSDIEPLDLGINFDDIKIYNVK